MRFVGGHVSIAGGLPNATTNTLKIGGNCMQIFAGSPRLWFRKPFSETEVSSFLKGNLENNIGPVFIHGLYLVNLATNNQDLLEKSVNSLVADLNNGSQIRSEGVIFHIGSHQGRGFDEVKDQLVASIQRILDLTKDTNLILENDAGQNGKIGSIEELSYLKEKINSNRIKICLDTAHLFESGVDLRNQHKINLFIEQLKELKIIDDVVCIHLNDSATDLDSHRDMHANLGEGKIGLEGLSFFINTKELKNLPLILEVPGDDRQGPNRHNINIAKEL